MLANAVDATNDIYQFTHFSREKKIAHMKTSEENENRRKTLEILVKRSGGIASFCRQYSKIDANKPMSPAFISQLLNRHRTFGEKAARNLEEQAGLEKYYFDQFKSRKAFETDNPNKLDLIKFIMALPDDDVDKQKVVLVKLSCLIDKKFVGGSVQILHAMCQPTKEYNAKEDKAEANGSNNNG